MKDSKLTNELKRYSVDVNDSLATIGLNMDLKEFSKITELHWHDFFEIEMVTGGTALHHQNNETKEIRPGSLCFLTPTEIHQVEPLESYKSINITFNDSWIPSDFLTLIMYKEQSVLYLSPDSFEFLKAVSKKMLEEFNQENPHRLIYLKNLINCILSEITRYLPPKNELSSKKELDVIRQALTYLYCNFRNSPSLHDVAKIAGLSDNYFSEVFHKATKQTYNRFLNDLKLQYAYNLVLHSDKSITDICFLSGFNSMTHFQREFKAKYRCSPSEKRLKGR